MAKYAIGTRVKVVRVAYAENSHLIGLEGVIIEIDCSERDERGTQDDLYALDTLPFYHQIIDGDLWFIGLTADQLVPIVPDGHKIADLTYEELLAWCEEELKEKVT